MRNKAIVRKWLLILIICAFLAPVTRPQDFKVVHEVQSRYQFITVLDTPNGYRQLIFDGRFDGTDSIQSEINLSNHYELSLSYARHIMAALPLVENPGRILVLGLGGASMQRYLHRLLPDARIETAELDPDILEIATSYFFFREDARQVVHLGDGRRFIENSKDKYDIIFLDAFSATSIPYALSTQEFLEAVKERLAPGGIVCANLWYTAAEFRDMLKTYAEVFPELHIIRAADSGNAILVAHPQKAGITTRSWIDKAHAFEKTRQTGLDLPRLIERGAVGALPDISSAKVLRDKK
jgi:spermidine synthase